MENDDTNPEKPTYDDETFNKMLSDSDQNFKRWVKKINKTRDNNYYTHQYHYEESQPKKAIYEEIVDDLVAIIAKLAKELGKKK